MNKVIAPEIITTERLHLRRPLPADAEAIFEYGSDPEVAYYSDWSPQTDIGGVRELLKQRPLRWEDGTDYHWVITLADEDRAIGGFSCKITGDSAEIGYLLNRRYWGQGITTEAGKAVVAWLSSLPTITKIWATCDTENIGSIRVLEKIGLTREAVLPRATVRPQISDEPRDAFLYSMTIAK